MKLDALHEAYVVAMKPQILGKPDNYSDIYRSSGPMRWYLSFSKDTPLKDGLTEDKDDFLPSGESNQPPKKVWQELEGHSKLTNSNLYFPKGTKKADPPRWTSKQVPPPEKDYTDFILK